MFTPKTRLSESEMRLIRILRDEVLFVSRPQVQMLLGCNFRRTNERLAKLVEERILRRRFRLDTYDNFRSPMYYLGFEGCRMIGMSKQEIQQYMRRIRDYSDRSVGHLLEVYDVFIKFLLESKVVRWMWHDDDKWFSIELGLYPDGFVVFEKLGTKFSAFIEVDRGTEDPSVLKGKFDKYRRFQETGAFRKLFGDCRFRVLVTTTTEERIEEMQAQEPMDDIWFATKQEFMRDSLWGRHWLAKYGLYTLDSIFPDPPDVPELAESLESEDTREAEDLNRRQEMNAARELGHKINNRLAWGSLYAFAGIWGLSLASLKPVVTLIILLIVLYAVIFS